MKIFAMLSLLVLGWQISAFAQCEAEPNLATAGKVLAKKTFKISEGKPSKNEVYLSFDASVAGTDWGRKNAEAAALTVFVDGKYNQDVLLFAGAAKFNYRVLLGNFADGEHELTIVFNEKRSAPKANTVVVSKLDILPASLNIAKEKEFEKNLTALLNAPFIYARPNAVDKFTDIPLVTYYEIISESADAYKIRYTTIFSHEDGGTQAAALMARWGRVTDIEWVYEITIKNGVAAEEIYQGANHETKNFAGNKIFGSHPLLFTATDNNNFADAGCSEIRTALLPVKADLNAASRETLMERFAWTYRVMAEEVIREGRVDNEKRAANIIADPRDYLYVEVSTELQNAAVSVEAKDGAAISDANNKLLRVNRSGFVRIALPFPRDAKSPLPKNIAVRCHAVDETKESVCKTLNIVKIVRLDEQFTPREKFLKQTPRANVKTGQTASFEIK